MQSEAQELLAQGRFGEALAAFEADLARDPSDATALVGRATALKNLGRFAEAEADFDTALVRMPDAAGARNNRGETLLALDRPEDALTDFERAVVLEPQMASAHMGRGIALQRLNRAVESLACFDRALTLWPASATGFFYRALSLEQLGRFEHAVASYDRALALNPNFLAAISNRAGMLIMLRRFGEAAAAFRKLDQMVPGNAHVLNGLAATTSFTCDWREWEKYRSEISEAVRGGKNEIPPSTLLAYSNDPALMLACARNYLKEMPRPAKPLWRGKPFSGNKIKLAYCSADFNAHPTAFLMAEIFERHDRSRFELTAIDFGADDQSTVRARLKKAFDHFHPLAGEGALAIAQRMAADGTDIAVDLMGLTVQARTAIFAHRPAPVQVNFLGYPGTMGADFMDYILADAVVAPHSQAGRYAEKILHLPDCYQPNDSTRPLPPAPTRGQTGLPDRAFVFCCFNNSWKFNPPMFDIWVRLLQAVPGSVLWLFAGNAEAAANLRRNATARGLEETRVVLAPRLDPVAHLARHRLADLFLDTLPYNAHTTASDALWMGLPVLTCKGAGFSGRVAASLLSAIGLPELIAENLDEYEKLALALARDPSRLAGLKKKLETNRLATALFDSERFTHNLETAYESMRDAFLARSY
jgi:predicted O-linked N-acetylglucosamine transferase (SPINDLY family)